MILVMDAAITDYSMYDEVLLQVEQIQFLAAMVTDFFLQTLSLLTLLIKSMFYLRVSFSRLMAVCSIAMIPTHTWEKMETSCVMIVVATLPTREISKKIRMILLVLRETFIL